MNKLMTNPALEVVSGMIESGLPRVAPQMLDVDPGLYSRLSFLFGMFFGMYQPVTARSLHRLLAAEQFPDEDVEETLLADQSAAVDLADLIQRYLPE